MVNPVARTIDNDKVHFATLAIGATSKKMGITATDLFNRLKRYNLIIIVVRLLRHAPRRKYRRCGLECNGILKK